MKEKILKSNIFWIVVIIIIWESISRLGIISSYVLPPFSKVVIQLVQELKEVSILIQVINSFRIVLLGLVISLIISIIVLILCDKFKNFEYFTRTICNILSPLPSVAILPLVIIWMGINDNAMLVLVVHSVVWPMIINLMEKVQSIPTVYHELLANLQIGSVKKVLCVYMMLILPGVIAAMRIGCARAWRSIISSEAIFGIIGTVGGLGMYIYVNRAYGNLTKVMVGIILIILISVIIDKIFVALEKLTIRKWRMSYERE